MVEGWHGDDYLILFNEKESTDFSLRYEVNKYIAGYKIIGLRGWDDFILQGSAGGFFTVPTVPLDLRDLASLDFNVKIQQISPDDQYRGKIKWYIKPILFGGDPRSAENITWVSIEQHIELVKWFNQLYLTMK